MSFQETPPPPTVPEQSNASHKSDRWALIAISIVGFILFLGVFGMGYTFRAYHIPSGAMIPTLQIGNYAVVSRASYGYSRYSFDWVSLPIEGRFPLMRPQRGDVVVFKLPRDRRTDYIKRIVGLPGDTVQMIKGRLFVNGQVIDRQPVAKVRAPDMNGRLTEVQTYNESLRDGETHQIVEIQGDAGYLDNTTLFEVPPDQYFVLGDNRDNSNDSRVSADQGGVGFVPLENLVGRMIFSF